MKNLENNKIIICSCHSTEHSFVICTHKDEPEAYLHIHLTSKPFHQRIVHAIKYIFGYRSQYGDFDEVVLHNKQVQEIIEQLQRVKLEE